MCTLRLFLPLLLLEPLAAAAARAMKVGYKSSFGSNSQPRQHRAQVKQAALAFTYGSSGCGRALATVSRADWQAGSLMHVVMSRNVVVEVEGKTEERKNFFLMFTY